MSGRALASALAVCGWVAAYAIGSWGYASQLSPLGVEPRVAFALVERSASAVAGGEAWRLLTSVLFHLSVPHLVFSSLAVVTTLTLAPFRRPFLALALALLAAGCTGALAVVSGAGNAVGGSALVAALVGLCWTHPETRSAAPRATALALAGLFAATVSGPADHAGHVFGLALGAGLGLVLGGLSDTSARLIVGATALLLAFAVACGAHHVSGCVTSLDALRACLLAVR